ncbi:MAG: hypothetical protein CMB56_000655 [Methanobacteriota archaeon]|nr:MAG: hypothetical protein CMB56_000655 [Euryarchaeota archaeon]|tara:strand:+ start:5618 stop:6088 length:471 start_codon:yes stop_codon:yes gene_type:complete
MNLRAKISTSDSVSHIILAIQELFPNENIQHIDIQKNFPNQQEKEDIIIKDVDYDYFFQRIHDTRIADTALDCMSHNLTLNHTTFKISRQAALAGKVSFVLDNESPLGGTFEIEVESGNLKAWIEDMTWHKGREDVPREINDELKMGMDGSPQDWF